MSRSPDSHQAAARSTSPHTHQHPHAQKLHDLQIFLNSAPALIHDEINQLSPTSAREPRMKRFLLPAGDAISCVWWDGIFHITGTDVVRSLVFRFEVTGRPVRNMKKFEEGVFSDLRNLKPGAASVMEEAKSPFLDLLFRHQCIRTQKKQKVFFWFEVDHDRLYLDALDRDLKREKLGMEPTTGNLGGSATSTGPSFDYDPRQSLAEQFLGNGPSTDGSLERTLRQLGVDGTGGSVPVSGASYAPRATPSNYVKGEPDSESSHLGKRGAAPAVISAEVYHAAMSRHYTNQAAAGSGPAPEDSGPSSKRRRGNDGEGVASEPRRPNSSSSRPGNLAPLNVATRHHHMPITGVSSSSVSASSHQGWKADPTYAGNSYHKQQREPDDDLRLTCPVQICRRVYIGRQEMLKHMRGHTAQDWEVKPTGTVAPPPSISVADSSSRSREPTLPARSTSADALSNNGRALQPSFLFGRPVAATAPPANLSSTRHSSPFKFTQQLYRGDTRSADSSPSVAHFPGRPHAYDSNQHQQLLSNKYVVPNSTLGLEGAMQPTYSPPDSVASSVEFSAPNVPTAGQELSFPYTQQVFPPSPLSVTSAPPTRTAFPFGAQENWRGELTSQKEVSLRRYHSATPTATPPPAAPSQATYTSYAPSTASPLNEGGPSSSSSSSTGGMATSQQQQQQQPPQQPHQQPRYPTSSPPAAAYSGVPAFERPVSYDGTNQSDVYNEHPQTYNGSSTSHAAGYARQTMVAPIINNPPPQPPQAYMSTNNVPSFNYPYEQYQSYAPSPYASV